MINKLHWLAALVVCGLSAPALADPVKVVAAENFYGDLARQIGGANVAVTSILSNPDDDPHLFEASPATAKALSDAKIVIANGVDYDPWMEKLLARQQSAGPQGNRGRRAGRPQARRQSAFWYDPDLHEGRRARRSSPISSPSTRRTRRTTSRAKPSSSSRSSLSTTRSPTMRKSYAGQPVTASEPVFGYQAKLIGLDVRNEKYALAIMNNAEPSPSQVAAFENDLKGKKVKAMLYNAQASEPAVGKLVQMAKDNGIPVVGVSETEPPNSTYQDWMMGQLNALDKALAGGA